MADHKATLAALVKTHGEEKIVGWVEAHLAQVDRRKEYSKSPEARAKAAERRERVKAELAEFRKFKEAQASKGKTK